MTAKRCDFTLFHDDLVLKFLSRSGGLDYLGRWATTFVYMDFVFWTSALVELVIRSLSNHFFISGDYFRSQFEHIVILRCCCISCLQTLACIRVRLVLETRLEWLFLVAKAADFRWPIVAIGMTCRELRAFLLLMDYYCRFVGFELWFDLVCACLRSQLCLGQVPASQVRFEFFGTTWARLL